MDTRFWSGVNMLGDCWEWTRSRYSNGYGRFSSKGKKLLAHRVAYELSVGGIPEGKVIDHLCRNRGCVNPSHLEAVTSGENSRRGAAPNQVTWRTDICKRGHSMSDAYVRSNGRRQCRPCVALRNRGSI